MDTTTYFWIGLSLGAFIGAIVGFAVCAVLAMGADSNIDDWEDE